MKKDSFLGTKDTAKDYSPNTTALSISQHSFGFIHGFIFCLIVKNICKHFKKESALLNSNDSFDRSVDVVTPSQFACTSDQSFAASADVKEEAPEAQTAAPARSADNSCSLTSQKFTSSFTGDENPSCDEKDSTIPSYYLPLTGSDLDIDSEGDDDEQSRDSYDRLPNDFTDVKDQPSPVAEKGKLRKRKHTNLKNVKEIKKRKQAEDPDQAQDSSSITIHNSKLTRKSKRKISQKLKTIKTKELETYSQKHNPGLTANSSPNLISDTTVKVGIIRVTDTTVPIASQVFACDKCDKTFTSARSCKRHSVRTHLRNGETAENNKGPKKHFRAQCDKCPKVYSGNRAEKNLHQHILAYHSELNPVQCDVCNITLNNEHHLKLHKRSSHRKDVCYICGAHFVTQIGLQTHLLAHKGDKSYVCEICGAAFVRVSSLRQHTKFHTDTRDFKCGRCPLSFKTFSSLSIHMMCVHQCGSYFSSQVQKLAKLGYVIDRDGMERLQNSQCVSCGQDLVDTVCPLHSSDCLLSFSCPQCQWTTKDIQKFRKHLVKRNSATVCSGTEETKTMKNCGGLTGKNRPLVKNFACPSCGKRFYTQSHLQAHRHQHAEKRFSCPVCNKSFTYKFNMQNHLTTHTDARPFECQLCQKTFKMKSQLQLHQRYHDGEFKCEICGKILTRKQHVINHYKLVHPEVQMPN